MQSHGGKPLAINPLGTNVGIGTRTPRSRLEVSAATDSGGSTLLRDPEAVLTLYRPGIPNQTWPNVAGFSISRYALEGTSARTRLDVGLSHGENTDTTPIMTWRSDGKVGIGTTVPNANLEVKGTTILEQEPWKSDGIEWPFGSGNSSVPAQYFKDSLGIVHLRGRLSWLNGFGGGSVMLKLPSKYRPEQSGLYIVVGLVRGAGRSSGILIEIDADGGIKAVLPEVIDWLHLDNISFKAAQ